jgi:putative transposase
MRLRELAQARPRFGYLSLHVMMQREGWVVNRTRVHRIYQEEGLMVRLTRRRKRASHLWVVPPQPRQLNEWWSMDFVVDTVLDGRRFSSLTVVDNYSRYSQIIEPDFTLTGMKMVTVLERVAKRSGYPQMITVDNGSEFALKALETWANDHGVTLDFIRPGTPVENAAIESFNGRFRDECVNANVFVSFHDARQKIEAWRIDDNEHRPHGSLGNRNTPRVCRTGSPNWAAGGTEFPVRHGLVFWEGSEVTKVQHSVVWVWGEVIPDPPLVVVPDRISRIHTVTRLAKRDDRCSGITSTHTPHAPVVDDRNEFIGLSAVRWKSARIFPN